MLKLYLDYETFYGSKLLRHAFIYLISVSLCLSNRAITTIIIILFHFYAVFCYECFHLFFPVYFSTNIFISRVFFSKLYMHALLFSSYICCTYNNVLVQSSVHCTQSNTITQSQLQSMFNGSSVWNSFIFHTTGFVCWLVIFLFSFYIIFFFFLVVVFGVVILIKLLLLLYSVVYFYIIKYYEYNNT